jgi:heme-degrading monooxygenase HmoA
LSVDTARPAGLQWQRSPPDEFIRRISGGFMSVLVITTVQADATVFEKVVADNAQAIRSISDEARAKGAQRHLFADDGAGNLLIVDVWDSRESFDAFFGSQPEIGRLMQEVGVTAQPSTVSYRVLDTPDMF